MSRLGASTLSMTMLVSACSAEIVDSEVDSVELLLAQATPVELKNEQFAHSRGVPLIPIRDCPTCFDTKPSIKKGWLMLKFEPDLQGCDLVKVSKLELKIDNARKWGNSKSLVASTWYQALLGTQPKASSNVELSYEGVTDTGKTERRIEAVKAY